MTQPDDNALEPVEETIALKDRIRSWARSRRPNRADLGKEALAGLPGAIGSVPDGMAASVLAGVNPIYGLYASMMGPIGGGLFASTARIVVTTTSAAALAAGSVLVSIEPAERPAALFLLTILAGLIMIVAGLLRLGRYVRFVSNSVMTGFLTGVAANIIFSQLPDLTGAETSAGSSVGKGFDVLIHPGSWNIRTLLAGLGALAIIVLASRSKYASIAALAALVIPSIFVAVFNADAVRLVADVGDIPRGIPLPRLPDLRQLSMNLFAGAAAVAAIVLVQGSGVAETAPNLDGSRSDANEDFIAQGVGNVAAGLFQGQPVGGSVGQTALNVSAGARTRWASIFSGIWMLVILVAFSPLVGRIAMATLAGVLIYAGIGAISIPQIRLILGSGPNSVIAFVTTFVSTLFLPIAAAVGIGVALSLLLQINREAMDLRVIELVPEEDGRVTIAKPPGDLSDREVVVLDVYGSLFYAGARTLDVLLPDPSPGRCPAVVLRLRGRTTLTSTAIEVLNNYQNQLEKVGGRLFLSGVEPGAALGLAASQNLDLLVQTEVLEARAELGASTRRAVEVARAWHTLAIDKYRADEGDPDGGPVDPSV